MIARPLDRSGDCVCGVAVALHFDEHDVKRSCEWAALRALLVSRPATPRATAVILPFTPRNRAVDPAELEHASRVAK